MEMWAPGTQEDDLRGAKRARQRTHVLSHPPSKKTTPKTWYSNPSCGQEGKAHASGVPSWLPLGPQKQGCQCRAKSKDRGPVVPSLGRWVVMVMVGKGMGEERQRWLPVVRKGVGT